MNWLYHYLGIQGTGPWYGFWSGFGADISELALVGAAVGLYRHHNCSATGCLRTRTYPVTGTPWKACRKHHPRIDETNARVTPERMASFAERHPEV